MSDDNVRPDPATSSQETAWHNEVQQIIAPESYVFALGLNETLDRWKSQYASLAFEMQGLQADWASQIERIASSPAAKALSIAQARFSEIAAAMPPWLDEFTTRHTNVFRRLEEQFRPIAEQMENWKRWYDAQIEALSVFGPRGWAVLSVPTDLLEKATEAARVDVEEGEGILLDFYCDDYLKARLEECYGSRDFRRR